MSVKIITDSTAEISDKYQEDIIVNPLTVTFGDESFIDGVELTRSDFFKKLDTDSNMPKTSQPTPETFEKIYKKMQDDGDDGVVITISEGMSGTYRSALTAAEKFNNIHIVDSANVSVGLGVQVEYAYKLAKEGKDAKTIVDILENNKKKARLVALLDTLKYLEKGGRISKVASFAGGILNIKPVVMVEDGLVKFFGKARGTQNGYNMLNKYILDTNIDTEKPMIIAYTGTSKDQLNKYLSDPSCIFKDYLKDVGTSQAGCTVGTHAGPNGIIIGYYSK